MNLIRRPIYIDISDKGKELFNLILKGSKYWVNQHKGKDLLLDYNSVKQLYNLLNEMKEKIGDNMAECMEFPKNILDFINDYSFEDRDEVYTNGSELIQVFRVVQALEHYAPELLDNK